MQRAMTILIFAGALLYSACSESAMTDATCPPEEGIAIQVLGSGGPIADDARASSSFLVWLDGKARILIDAGGGSFLRFGEASANFADLKFIGLSHFHADHSADFPALLKSGYFSNRDGPLMLAGPSGSQRFPGLAKYLSGILDPSDGAYAYLSGYLDGTGGLARIEPYEVSGTTSPSKNLLQGSGGKIAIYAMHVPHGIVPAIAFRIEVRGKSIVFASDQNGSDNEFAKFAGNASVLVMHMPISELATSGARQLHAPPSKIAQIAARADADSLLLSHFMARSLRNLEENVQIVREGYAGKLLIAEDLYCLAVP